MYLRDPQQVLRAEVVVEEVAQQHAYAEAHRVLVARGHPSLYVWQQFGMVAGEAARRQLVAGGPVVYKGQEGVYPRHTASEVALLADDEGVQLVFLEVAMWQCGEEGLCVSAFGHLLGYGAQRRRAHTYDALRSQGGEEAPLEVAVALVAQLSQFVDDVFPHDQCSIPTSHFPYADGETAAGGHPQFQFAL